jgi:hypothetical protein
MFGGIYAPGDPHAFFIAGGKLPEGIGYLGNMLRRCHSVIPLIFGFCGLIQIQQADVCLPEKFIMVEDAPEKMMTARSV